MSLLLPNIVITAPDGSTLWIDAAQALHDDGSPSLWPAGFKVSLSNGTIPANGTTSPASFLTAQIPTLLKTPGPLGVEWGIWLLLGGSLLTLAIVKLRAK